MLKKKLIDTELYQKTYYLPKSFLTEWQHARGICQQYGMEIISFESSEEANNFLDIVEKYNLHETPPYWIYIGGMTNVLKSKSDWYWMNSGNKVNYELKWGPGEPNNNNGREYCLDIGRYNVDDKNLPFFNDAGCYSKSYMFVCQIAYTQEDPVNFTE
jgi:hypothetical protein